MKAFFQPEDPDKNSWLRMCILIHWHFTQALFYPWDVPAEWESIRKKTKFQTLP